SHTSCLQHPRSPDTSVRVRKQWQAEHDDDESHERTFEVDHHVTPSSYPHPHCRTLFHLTKRFSVLPFRPLPFSSRTGSGCLPGHGPCIWRPLNTDVLGFDKKALPGLTRPSKWIREQNSECATFSYSSGTNFSRSLVTIKME